MAQQAAQTQLSNNLDDSEQKNKAKNIRVFIAAISANLSIASSSTGMGWPSPIIPKLKTIDSPLSQPIDQYAEAWIGSIIAIGAAITPFIAGPLSKKFGRKKILLSSASFVIAAYILMLFASQIWIMLLARFIKGFGFGFAMVIVPMYCGEIATDNIRGALGALMSLHFIIGIYAVLCIGPFVSYNTVQYFCIGLPCMFVFAFSFMPESPYFFIAKGKRIEALKALKFLRGQSNEIVEKELTSIELMVKISSAKRGTFKSLFVNRANRKALFICLGLITHQQLSGINAVLFNAQSILDHTDMGLKGPIATIVVYTVQLFTAIFSPFIADRFNRRTILLATSCFMGIGLSFLGYFFFAKSQMDNVKTLVWLPMTSLVLYIFMFVIGYGSMPWAILSEMFAPNIKPIATAIVATQFWIVCFFVTYFFPSLQALGVYYAFWLFGFLCFPMAFIFSIFAVIETRGLSLQEIQRRLNEK